MTCMRESLLNYLKTYLLIYLDVLVSYCSDIPVVVIALWYQLGEGACFGDIWQSSHCKIMLLVLLYFEVSFF